VQPQIRRGRLLVSCKQLRPRLTAGLFVLWPIRRRNGCCTPHVRHLPDQRGDGVATKAEDYRAKARECEESAAKTQDSFIRQQMLEIAEKWRHMADREAKRSR
jgi:hypothetical protein